MSASMPHVMNTYGRLPVALSHGRGCEVWDTRGRRYLDALGGIAVNTLGHAHPKLVEALQAQIGQLIHCSNYYESPLQEQLATLLCERSGLDVAFFCSTGLEANEAALKIARKYGHDKGIERPEIAVVDDHVVGDRESRRPTGLHGQDRPRRRRIGLIACHDPLQLLFFWAIDHQHPIEFGRAAALGQQRNHEYLIGAAARRCAFGHRGTNARMRDRLEIAARCRIGEHDGTQRPSIDGAEIGRAHV